MKLKVFTLYTAGLALLVSAAGAGDGFNTLPAPVWGSNVLCSVILAILGIICLGYGRGLEIEQHSRKRLRRIERPAYRQNRKDA